MGVPPPPVEQALVPAKEVCIVREEISMQLRLLLVRE